jgi:uncharacterized membrane protein
MRLQTFTRGAIAGGLFFVALGGATGRLARAQPDAADEAPTPRRLIYAAYKNEEAATQAFKALKAAEAKGVIKIESYAVVTKRVDGTVKVKDQREKGTRTGAIVGALVGLLGGPVGAAIGVAAGSGTGYLAGDAVGMPKETIERVQSSLQPGESAIIAVVDEKWAAATEKLQGEKAIRLMTHAIPIATKDKGGSGGAKARPAPPLVH